MRHNPYVDVTKETTTLYASDCDVFIDDSKFVEVGGVGLSDKPWHSPSDHGRWLKLNPQFEETRIEKDEFEAVWEAAVGSPPIDRHMGPS